MRSCVRSANLGSRQAASNCANGSGASTASASRGFFSVPAGTLRMRAFAGRFRVAVLCKTRLCDAAHPDDAAHTVGVVFAVPDDLALLAEDPAIELAVDAE
jgi:hypothetical protein